MTGHTQPAPCGSCQHFEQAQTMAGCTACAERNLVTVRFVTEDGPVSEGIREVTWCPISHVEFVLPGGRCIGARHSGGVQNRPLNFARFTLEEWFTFPVKNKAAADAWLQKQIGKPYDTEAIFGILLHHDWRDENHWFCSELVARYAEIGESPLLRPEPHINRITPRDTYLSPLLTSTPVLPY